MRMKCVSGLFLRFLALPCLFFLLAGAGCALQGKALQERPQEQQWTCDRHADELLQKGDIEAAILAHEKLLRESPDNALALYHLGYAYGRMGNHPKEIEFYNRAVSLGLKTEQIYFNLGMAYGESGLPDHAARAFLKGLELNPKSVDNRFGLAMTYHQKGETKKAVAELEKILTIDPSFGPAKEWLERLQKK